MIAGGRELIVSAPWVSLAPGLAVIITVVSATILGDAWRDRLTTTTPARILSERA
jgi:peptide/nickel transport system permease protein